MQLSKLDTLSPTLLFAMTGTAIGQGFGLVLATIAFWVALSIAYLAFARRALRPARSASSELTAPVFAGGGESLEAGVKEAGPLKVRWNMQPDE